MPKEIVGKAGVIARHIKPEDHKSGLNFFSEDEEFVQVGSWYKYESGKYLAKHYHNKLERKTDITQEVFVIMKGRVETKMYDEDLSDVGSLILEEGDILIFFRGGHDFTILEDDTIVYELKNGPFYGSDKDKTKF